MGGDARGVAFLVMADAAKFSHLKHVIWATLKDTCPWRNNAHDSQPDHAEISCGSPGSPGTRIFSTSA